MKWEEVLKIQQLTTVHSIKDIPDIPDDEDCWRRLKEGLKYIDRQAVFFDFNDQRWSWDMDEGMACKIIEMIDEGTTIISSNKNKIGAPNFSTFEGRQVYVAIEWMFSFISVEIIFENKAGNFEKLNIYEYGIHEKSKEWRDKVKEILEEFGRKVGVKIEVGRTD